MGEGLKRANATSNKGDGKLRDPVEEHCSMLALKTTRPRITTYCVHVMNDLQGNCPIELPTVVDRLAGGVIGRTTLAYGR